MKHCAILFIAFASAGLVISPTAAAPASFVRPQNGSAGISSWTCIGVPGAGDSTAVTMNGANSACFSSNGGLDCQWHSSSAACAAAGPPAPGTPTLVCGSEAYNQRFGDYGYGRHDSWCCLALKAMTDGNFSKPSSLPESAPFKCSSAPLSASPGLLDAGATLCNTLTNPIVVFKWDELTFKRNDSGNLINPGQCFSWRDPFSVELLVYRQTSADEYTAAAWAITYTDGGMDRAGAAVSFITHKIPGTEQCSPDWFGRWFELYEYRTWNADGHFRIAVNRVPSYDGATQIQFTVSMLESQITVEDQPCIGAVDVNIKYP